MAKKATPAGARANKAAAALPAADTPKAGGGKLATTLRIDPDKLVALKAISVRHRKRVNDLVLEGIDHILGRYS